MDCQIVCGRVQDTENLGKPGKTWKNLKSAWRADVALTGHAFSRGGWLSRRTAEKSFGKRDFLRVRDQGI
jgi:hypothetical protein